MPCTVTPPTPLMSAVGEPANQAVRKLKASWTATRTTYGRGLGKIGVFNFHQVRGEAATDLGIPHIDRTSQWS